MIGASTEAGVCRTRVEGEMSIYTAPELRERLLECLEGCDELEIDLSGVTEVDSTSVQLLIQAKREGAARGTAVRFVGHSGPVQEIIDLYRLGAEFGDPMVISSQ